jgi:hypothetical protein
MYPSRVSNPKQGEKEQRSNEITIGCRDSNPETGEKEQRSNEITIGSRAWNPKPGDKQRSNEITSRIEHRTQDQIRNNVETK